MTANDTQYQPGKPIKELRQSFRREDSRGARALLSTTDKRYEQFISRCEKQGIPLRSYLSQSGLIKVTSQGPPSGECFFVTQIGHPLRILAPLNPRHPPPSTHKHTYVPSPPASRWLRSPATQIISRVDLRQVSQCLVLNSFQICFFQDLPVSSI